MVPRFLALTWSSLLYPHLYIILTGHFHLYIPQALSVQFSSVAQSCPTLCDPMDCSTPGFPVHHQLPEFTQTHVDWVGDATQPSHPLSSPSPPASNPSQHQSLPMSQLFAWGGQSTRYDLSPPVLCPWDSPGKNTGMGFHVLLQELFLTQGLNLCLLCLLHWQAGSLPLSHLEAPGQDITWDKSGDALGLFA